jgi:pimeloyl-ACP methyl ester carboxylesterase
MDVSRRQVLGGAAALAALAAVPGATGLAAAVPRATPVGPLPVTPLPLFASAAFNDEALFALGGASSASAEVGEVLRIAQEANARSGNPAEPGTAAFDAYVDAFGAFGSRLARLARESGAAHPVTTRNRSLRAATYAAQQLFFVLGTSAPDREERLFDVCQARWMRAVRLFEPAVVPFAVDSPHGRIPGYFFPSPTGSGRRPTLIISEGSDGQNAETMQFGVTAGLERGYNVVLFEGPGQMSLLFKRRIPFTPDWNTVVGPVLEWTRARPDVGKVALIGVSFGGMICSRAAARLSGLDAVVLQPGAYDMTTLWDDQESFALVKETQNTPAAEKEGARRGLNQGFLEAWPTLPKVQQFTIYKRGEIFSPRVQREARAGLPVSDYYGLLEAMLPFRYRRDYQAITIPTMVTANEGDENFGSQPEEAFGFLDRVPASRKELVRLTAAQGASLHDQPVGPQVAQEIVFDWLDDQLS